MQQRANWNGPVDYLLSGEHPVGRFKARFFTVLGCRSSDWTQLQADLLRLAQVGDASEGQPSVYGVKYELRGVLRGPNGRAASVVTVWIVTRESEIPRFVTAFPGEHP